MAYLGHDRLSATSILFEWKIIPSMRAINLSVRRYGQVCSRRKRTHARDDCARALHRAERQEHFKANRINPCVDNASFKDRPDFRRKDERTVRIGVVEWFDSKSVHGQQQLPLPAIPKREGKHASKAREDVSHPLLVAVQYRLGV